MKIFPARLAFPLLLAAPALACEERQAGPATVADSAGVRIVVNDLSASDAMCTTGDEPLLVVGNREDDSAHLFGRVVGTARLSDGSIAVVDPTADEVRLFDQTGQHLWSMGGEGDGPGEFRKAWLIWVRPGDTLWVGDYRPWRYNVFAADGIWSRAVELDPIYPNPPRGGGGGGGVLSGGTLVVARVTRNTPSFETPDTLIVEAHDSDGKLLRVVARIPNRRMGVLPSAFGDLQLGPVFDSQASASARGDRIAIATGAEPEIRVLDADFKLTTIVRWDAGDRSVSGSDADAYRDEIRAQRAGGPPGFDDPSLSPDRPVADMFPAFSSLTLGNAGHLFVFPYRRPGQPRDPTMVFAPTGEFMCRLALDPQYSLWEAGADYLLGVQLDEYDNESVVLHSFGPPETTP